MPKKQFYDYEGVVALVRYEPKRCIHAEECVKGLPGVFERDRRPWIEPDRASPEELVEVVSRCPTGALQVERRDGGPEVAEPEINTARLVADGPIYVEGKLQLRLADGSSKAERRVALCRCGQSANKPFCDNSHQEAGFTDPGLFSVSTVAAAPPSASPPVELRAAPSGPMLFRGPLRIEAAEGGESQHKDRGSLCRCGASSNKPYCDGSHVAAGFEAD